MKEKTRLILLWSMRVFIVIGMIVLVSKTLTPLQGFLELLIDFLNLTIMNQTTRFAFILVSIYVSIQIISVGVNAIYKIWEMFEKWFEKPK